MEQMRATVNPVCRHNYLVVENFLVQLQGECGRHRERHVRETQRHRNRDSDQEEPAGS